MITLQFINHSTIQHLPPERKVRKLLETVKEDKIILLEGRLTKQEEAHLIQATMEHINGRFRGIELSVLSSDQKQQGLMKQVQHSLIGLLTGGRHGITIIGPATIVKEIKKDPDKIQLLMVEARAAKRKKKP